MYSCPSSSYCWEICQRPPTTLIERHTWVRIDYTNIIVEGCKVMMANNIIWGCHMTKLVNSTNHHLSFRQTLKPQLVCSNAVSCLMLSLHLMIFSGKVSPLTAQLPPSCAVHHLPCWCDRLHVFIVLTEKKKTSSHPESHHPAFTR